MAACLSTATSRPWSTDTADPGEAQTAGPLQRTRGNSCLLPVQKTEGTPPPLSPQNPFPHTPSAFSLGEWNPSSGQQEGTLPQPHRGSLEQEHSAWHPSPHREQPRESDKIPSMLCGSITCQTHNQPNSPGLPACLPAWGLFERWGPWWPAPLSPLGKLLATKNPTPTSPDTRQ